MSMFVTWPVQLCSGHLEISFYEWSNITRPVGFWCSSSNDIFCVDNYLTKERWYRLQYFLPPLFSSYFLSSLLFCRISYVFATLFHPPLRFHRRTQQQFHRWKIFWSRNCYFSSSFSFSSSSLSLLPRKKVLLEVFIFFQIRKSKTNKKPRYMQRMKCN